MRGRITTCPECPGGRPEGTDNEARADIAQVHPPFEAGRLGLLEAPVGQAAY